MIIIDDDDDSYGEARGNFERTRDETGLNSVDSDSGEDEVFVERGRNRVESRHGV